MSSKTLAQSFDRIERHLTRLWREKAASEVIETDVSYNEYDYIKTVFELCSPRLSDLAETMKVSKPSATAMVQKLEKRGFFKRTPCPVDRRAIRIEVTDKAQMMFRADQEVFQKLIEKISSEMPEKDLKALERLLSKACDCLS